MNQQQLQFSRSCRWIWQKTPSKKVRKLWKCTTLKQPSCNNEWSTVNKYIIYVRLCKKIKWTQSHAIPTNFGSSLGIAIDLFWTKSNSYGGNSSISLVFVVYNSWGIAFSLAVGLAHELNLTAFYFLVLVHALLRIPQKYLPKLWKPNHCGNTWTPQQQYLCSISC